MSEPIYHLAEAQEWERALEQGRYERSTLGLSLAEVGFVHCSRAQQWGPTRRRFFGAHPGDLVLLTIDPDRLTSPVVHEPPVPPAGDGPAGGPASDEQVETFPHVYGPIDLDAVIATRTLHPPHA